MPISAPSITVRKANIADAASIASIYNESVRAGGTTMDDVEKTEADVVQEMKSFHSREGYLLLLKNEVTIGWAAYRRYSNKAGYRFACETAIYLHREATGQGLGHILQTALIAHCKSISYHHLVAKIYGSNTRSIRFHELYGYELVGMQREIGFKEGRWEDVALMQCILDA